MVVRIWDDDTIRVAHGDVVRMFKLAGLAAHAAKLAHERAVWLEDLNPVILLITNVDKAEGIGCDAPGVAKLAVGGPLTAERSQKVTKRIENLNPVIVPISDDVLADSVDSHPGQAVEFAVAVAINLAKVAYHDWIKGSQGTA